MKILFIPSNLKGVYQQWSRLQQVHKLYSEKKWLDCISLANELTSAQENDFFGFYYRGICNTEFKFFDDALNDFESALVNLKKNKFPEIMEEYEQETELRIAHVFRLQRKYYTALERLDNLINHHPKYAFPYKSKAGIQVDMDELQSALETANQGLAEKPYDKELENLRNSLVYDLTTNRNE
jgi:tetratricopeptide (TPR) repeat protein